MSREEAASRPWPTLERLGENVPVATTFRRTVIHSGLSVADVEAIVGKAETLLRGPAAETAIG